MLKKYLFTVLFIFCSVLYLQAQNKENVIKYLPKNYSKIGDIDYTNYLQKAINNESEVILPNFPIRINSKGLTLKSNFKLIFQRNSSLLLIPNNQSSYQIINLVNLTNVTIQNPTIVGDRANHLGSKGEWGMGIKILSSSNIRIVNPNISNCWGDAIYIGRSSSGKSYSEKISVVGGELNWNRRNGISIISGKDIYIQNLLIKNTNGTNPMAAIDLEPNSSDELLYNINLLNIKTINNKIDGIKIVFHKLLKQNNVLINISNHYDHGSQNPLTIVGNDSVQNKLTGLINYKNPKWSNSSSNIRIQRKISKNLIFSMDKVDINGVFFTKKIKL